MRVRLCCESTRCDRVTEHLRSHAKSIHFLLDAVNRTKKSIGSKKLIRGIRCSLFCAVIVLCCSGTAFAQTKEFEIRDFTDHLRCWALHSAPKRRCFDLRSVDLDDDFEHGTSWGRRRPVRSGYQQIFLAMATKIFENAKQSIRFSPYSANS